MFYAVALVLDKCKTSVRLFLIYVLVVELTAKSQTQFLQANFGPKVVDWQDWVPLSAV